MTTNDRAQFVVIVSAAPDVPDPRKTPMRHIGAGLFAVSHALYVDRDGNVWAGDQIARNGKGADLIKFSPDAKVLMTVGKPGMSGNAHA